MTGPVLMSSSSSGEEKKRLSGWDIAVVVGYFAAILATSVYTMLSHRRNTVDSYFLAGRKMIWIFVGASLFASNIGSEHFIGLAGSGAASGMGVSAFELNAMLILQILGWVFLPVFIASSVTTLPEYMKKRFGGSRIRVYLSVLSLVLYIFTKISVNLYSGALFINVALGWSIYPAIFLILGMTGLFTVTGGLAGVIYTETIQSVIMIGGGLTLMGFAFAEIGGMRNLYTRYMDTSRLNRTMPNYECAVPRRNAFTILRGINDKDMPWLGFFLGQTPGSIWYWCSDQMMVQRTLSAKTLSHAQGGTIFAGYLKILPMFMMIFPGMISRVLYPDTVGCHDPDVCERVCNSRNGCSNIAYPTLIMNLMPDGLKGLMLAVMLAALMSDLTSIFNSSATLFTVDIYKQVLKKNASNRQLMIAGRAFVFIMVIVGVAWVPIIMNMQGAQLYIYIQSVAAYFSPPIAAVYLLAVLWTGANEPGAFWSLMSGLLIGLVRMILDFIYIEPACGEVDHRPVIIKDFHYMYFAVLLFFVTCLVMIVVSLSTKKVESYRLIRTTYWTRFITDKRPDETDDFRQDKEENGDQQHQQTHALDSMVNSESNINDEEVVVEKSKDSKSRRLLDVFLNVICGLESTRTRNQVDNNNNLDDEKMTERERQARAESARRVQSFYSLKQTRVERYVLNINLVMIICIAIGLYTFYSIPPEYHIFKGVPINYYSNSTR